MSSEAEKINELYHEQGLTQCEIGRRMDLSQPAVSRKMKRYGIESDYGGFWTKEEIEKLKKNYKEVKYEEVDKMFPERSWNAIRLKAMELGLSTPKEEHRHSEEVKQVLQDNAEKAKIEIDLERSEEISYILGVIDGDGFHNGNGTVGLETKSVDFAEKFAGNLRSAGFNPGRGNRREKETVWASSEEFTGWLKRRDNNSKYAWLEEKGDFWKYIEGAYDSDGDFSNLGPRICSYDEGEKKLLKRILEKLGLDPSVHTNNVYVPVPDKKEFFR